MSRDAIALVSSTRCQPSGESGHATGFAQHEPLQHKAREAAGPWPVARRRSFLPDPHTATTCCHPEDAVPDPVSVTLTHLSAPVGGSQRLTGHLVRPDGPGPWPGVVVAHEVLGANDEMLRQARRLAGAGYLTLMPDLYTDGGKRRCLIPTMRAALSGHGRAYQDIAAARAHLVGDPACTGAVGIIGFCMGGSFALMAAGSGIFDAASANYGQPPKDMDKALADACPIVASYGGRDRQLKGAAARLD